MVGVEVERKAGTRSCISLWAMVKSGFNPTCNMKPLEVYKQRQYDLIILKIRSMRLSLPAAREWGNLELPSHHK